MGRPSKLNEKKWEELLRRHAGGEKAADLAREYKVSPTQISRRVTQVSRNVQAVANQIATAESALAELPKSQQRIAIALSERLRGISNGLAEAADHGAQVAAKLNRVAAERTSLLVDAGMIEAEELKIVAALVETANRSAHIGVNLLAANKDQLKVGEKTLEQLVTGGE